MAGEAVLLSTKQKHTVSLSLTESEYKALTMGAQEAVWLQQLLLELNPTTLAAVRLHCKDVSIAATLGSPKVEKENTKDVTTIHCDHQSALKMTNNSVFHARTKHIGIQHHFI
jgi:hypothetical protein